MNTMAFVALLTRRGRLVLASTALVMAAAVVGIFRLEIQTDFSVFMPPESPFLDAMQRTAAAFGDSGQLIVLAEVGSGPGATETLKTLPGIAADLVTIPGVQAAQSPVPQSLVGLSGTEFDDALEQLQVLSGGASLTEHEGTRYAAFRLLLTEDAAFGSVISAVTDRFESAGLPVTISGEPYLEAEIFNYILRIIITIPPIAILLMLIVFRLRIGSFRATVLSMVPAIVGAVLTLGVMGWIQGSVSIVSALVPIFVIVLGSADGLHITSHVMDSLKNGDDNREAVTKTLRAVGVPVVMTTVTTMTGFLSLLVINSRAIQELGVAAALGILIAGVATWITLPTILLHQKPLAVKSARTQRNLIADGLSRLRGWPSVVIAAALVAAFIPGALSLRANLSMIDVYKPGTSVRQSIDKAADVLGGSIPVYVVFPAEEELVPELADAVLRLQDQAKSAGLAGQSLSAYGIVRNLWESISGNVGYPDSLVIAKTMITRIRLSNRGFMDTFFAEDGTGRAVFFLRDLDGTTLQEFQDLAARVSRETGIQLQPVGTAFVMKEMNDQIIPQQLASLGLAAAMIFLLTALTHRSILLGLASTTPIIITLVTLYGVMGYARIDLSIITGIMSGLTIGVGIDYAIHYVSLLKQARERGDEAPSDTALGYVATPVVANALGLAVGFTAMLFSPLQIHVTLCILMWVTMVTSAFLSLTFLPTITARGRGGSEARR